VDQHQYGRTEGLKIAREPHQALGFLLAGDFERAVHIFAHPAAALFVRTIEFGRIDMIFRRVCLASLGKFLRNPIEQLLHRIAGKNDAMPRLGVATRR